MTYPKTLIEAALGRLDLHEDSDHAPAIELLDQLTPKERFSLYLEWNGILGYTETLWEIAHANKSAEQVKEEMVDCIDRQIAGDYAAANIFFILDGFNNKELNAVRAFVQSFDSVSTRETPVTRITRVDGSKL